MSRSATTTAARFFATAAATANRCSNREPASIASTDHDGGVSDEGRPGDCHRTGPHLCILLARQPPRLANGLGGVRLLPAPCRATPEAPDRGAATMRTVVRFVAVGGRTPCPARLERPRGPRARPAEPIFRPGSLRPELPHLDAYQEGLSPNRSKPLPQGSPNLPCFRPRPQPSVPEGQKSSQRSAGPGSSHSGRAEWGLALVCLVHEILEGDQWAVSQVRRQGGAGVRLSRSAGRYDGRPVRNAFGPRPRPPPRSSSSSAASVAASARTTTPRHGPRVMRAASRPSCREPGRTGTKNHFPRPTRDRP
jgi:hypothetical protein